MAYVLIINQTVGTGRSLTIPLQCFDIKKQSLNQIALKQGLLIHTHTTLTFFLMKKTNYY